VADPTTLAIDVAFLLPHSLNHSLTALNRTLRLTPDGFQFDATHLPHLTLVQQFAKENDLEEITRVIKDLLPHQAPVELVTTRISHAHVASTLGIRRTDELVALHRRLLGGLAPFRARADGRDAFWTDGDTPRTADIEWVAMFREQASLERFDPHITIGVGAIAAHVDTTSFAAAELALCHLGRFCTCRRVLSAWTLTAPGR